MPLLKRCYPIKEFVGGPIVDNEQCISSCIATQFQEHQLYPSWVAKSFSTNLLNVFRLGSAMGALVPSNFP